MRVDLLAGATYNPAVMPSPVPTILVFDSGLGGLTVFSEVLKIRPDARYVYAADDAGFPYGRLSRGGPGGAGRRRHGAADRAPRSRHSRWWPATPPRPSCCRICGRALLHSLRRHGPGDQAGGSDHADRLRHGARHPGTVARDYTRDLIETYAAGCKVNLVGSRRLAGFAEAELAGSPVSDEELLDGARSLLRRGCRRAGPMWWR